jgi:hypothetical protein
MPFFQNPMGSEFREGWPIDQSALFFISANNGNIGTQMSVPGPYDFSAGGVLTINYSTEISIPRRAYFPIAIDVTGAIPSATTATEVYNILAANTLFTDWFYVFLANWPGNGVSAPPNGGPNVGDGGPYAIQIYSKLAPQAITWYVSNCGAESAMKFNRFAKVKQLPTYFARDTVANVYTFPDGAGMLIQLDPTIPCQAQLIVDAGQAFEVFLTNGSPIVTTVDTSPYTVGDSIVMFDGTTAVAANILSIIPNVSITASAPWTGPTENGYVINVLADWQLLIGRSDHETFDNITYDGSGRTIQVITYFTGARVGDNSVKMQYQYVGASTQPSVITQVPYVLTAADLVTPP